jgi:hypothetical protein
MKKKGLPEVDGITPAAPSWECQQRQPAGVSVPAVSYQCGPLTGPINP